jgi:hypothetical protein
MRSFLFTFFLIASISSNLINPESLSFEPTVSSIEPTLASVLGVLYKNIKNFNQTDEVQSQKLTSLLEVDQDCVLNYLDIPTIQQNPNLTITNITEFESQNPLNRKIIFAIKNAADLCVIDSVLDESDEPLRAILSFTMQEWRDVEYEQTIDCLKLWLQDLDENSKILENFSTNVSKSECDGLENDSFGPVLDEENYESLNISRCSVEEFSAAKEQQVVVLTLTILANLPNTMRNWKIGMEMAERSLVFGGERKIECILMDLE